MPNPAQWARVPPTAVVLLAILAGPARADEFVRAQIMVDAAAPPAATVRYGLTWNAEGGKPRSELAFHLARDLEVTAAESEGKALTFRAEDLADSGLRRWIVRLPVPLAPGASRSLEITTRGPASSGPGIHLDDRGGCLLPGSGWFPSIQPERDELTPHTTEFRLPTGWSGVAAGTKAAGSSGWTAPPGRPYAAWGAYRVEEVPAEGLSLSVWRREGSGPVPRQETLTKLIGALSTGLGEAPGTGAWKLVDVGRSLTAGGQRTLFWNSSAVTKAGKESPDVVDRDLAVGLAEAYWQESVRVSGPQAAFLSGGITRYLGDATALTLDRTDDHWRAEARIIGERRAAFTSARAKDRPLAGLAPHSPAAAAILDGRGALVAHMAADACPSEAHWVSFLRGVRTKPEGILEGDDFFARLAKRFPNQHVSLKPLLETKDLPDFGLADHGPSQGRNQVDRYRVEVANRGKVPGKVEVGIYTSNDRLIRSTRLLVPAGGRQSVLFGDARRIARIRIDPRCMSLQSDYEGETIDVKPVDVADEPGYRPAFPFSPVVGVLRAVPRLDLALGDVTIKGFQGSALVYETHHGPSGAVLLGPATVEIAPRAPFAEAMRSALGTDRLSFPAQDLFVRFPVGVWPRISPDVGEPLDAEKNRELSPRRQFVYEHCFPVHMSQGNLAQVPPPGSALVVFCLGGEEWRGFLTEPLPDGRTRMRLWDHLRGKPLWEAIL